MSGVKTPLVETTAGKINPGLIADAERLWREASSVAYRRMREKLSVFWGFFSFARLAFRAAVLRRFLRSRQGRPDLSNAWTLGF